MRWISSISESFRWGAGRWLVQTQQLGLGSQRPCDLKPALTSVRQVFGLDISYVGDADEVEQTHPHVDGVVLLAAVTRCAQQCSPDRGLVTGIGSHGNVLQRRHLPKSRMFWNVRAMPRRVIW